MKLYITSIGVLFFIYLGISQDNTALTINEAAFIAAIMLSITISH